MYRAFCSLTRSCARSTRGLAKQSDTDASAPLRFPAWMSATMDGDRLSAAMAATSACLREPDVARPEHCRRFPRPTTRSAVPTDGETTAEAQKRRSRDAIAATGMSRAEHCPRGRRGRSDLQRGGDARRLASRKRFSTMPLRNSGARNWRTSWCLAGRSRPGCRRRSGADGLSTSRFS